MSEAEAVQQLHERCAIYTSAEAAAQLLDAIGWTATADLGTLSLLEPSVGEGAILLEGVRRLVASMRSHGRGCAKAKLLPRIKGFEIHPATARTARILVRRELMNLGLAWDTAAELADHWVQERDFLLERPGRVTHVVANPPYVRWSKVPAALADRYRRVLPVSTTRGDLSVAFLHRMQEWAGEGVVGALVSDRWMFAQYAEAFVKDLQALGWSIHVVDERPAQPFVRTVGAYCAMVVLRRTLLDVPTPARSTERSRAKAWHAALVALHGTLGEAGCTVRVGPALGAGRTFIVEKDALADVEQELVRPFLERKDLANGDNPVAQRRVIVPYDRAGRLVEPSAWPRFEVWARAHKDALSARSHFSGSGHYWRTIDAVPALWSAAPKLLLPELCTRPSVIVDNTAAIPAHSIYAIWPGAWPVDALTRVLNGGLLEITARAEAPTLKSGWYRFYKRFIVRTPLPKWTELPDDDRAALSSDDGKFSTAFERLFGFPPGRLPV